MPILVCQQKEKILLSQNLQISICRLIFEILVQILACDLYMSLWTNGLQQYRVQNDSFYDISATEFDMP